jgi:homoserine O-acetyltransferase
LGRGDLAEAFKDVRAKFLVLSYSSDWLYPPEQSEELVRALLRNGIDASYVEIKSDYGHDAFLLEVERLAELARDFLAKVERETVRPTGPVEGPSTSNEERGEKVYPLASLAAKARGALRLADVRRRETA